VELKLSTNIVSQVDVARISRELKGLDDFFIDANNRTAGTSIQLPRLTRMLDELAKENNYNLLEEEHRRALKQQLDVVIGKAPQLHISFAAEPSAKALERILIWFRTNIHPQVLLQVGLQPGIAAGCVIRTANRVFDMSLRQHLDEQQMYLAQLIDVAAKRS
jgi:F0F1-type ATP synthase delta subunit